MYTVTCYAAANAPMSLKLEASNDGINSKTLDERTELVYNWDTYTRAYEIPEETAGTYLHYRLTFGGDAMQIAEVEFLGQTNKGAELTPIEVPAPESPNTVDPDANAGAPDGNNAVWIWCVVGAVAVVATVVVVIVIAAKKRKK